MESKKKTGYKRSSLGKAAKNGYLLRSKAEELQVSERMLVQTLQWLESDGLVDRVALGVVPPHVEYSLTHRGRQAAEKVRGLADWIELNLPQILAARR